MGNAGERYTPVAAPISKHGLTSILVALLAVVFSMQTALAEESQDAVGTDSQSICSGEVPNGWRFTSDAVDGRFLHVIWMGPQGQARATILSHYAENADGFRVFTGVLEDTIEIVLVDRSGGSPKAGTGIELFTEEWGWLSGTCRELDDGALQYLGITETVRKSLVGLRDTSGTNWLRRNGFNRDRTVELNRTGKIERWSNDEGRSIEVVFHNRRISDVLTVVD